MCQRPPSTRRPDPLGTAIGRLDELWDDEYLPQIKRHLRTGRRSIRRTWPCRSSSTPLDDSVERTRRLYEIHFLIWLPFMSAISLFDDFYRDVLGSVSDFDAYRLLQGFDNKTVAKRAGVVAAQPAALRVASVRAVLERSRPRPSPPH